MQGTREESERKGEKAGELATTEREDWEPKMERLSHLEKVLSRSMQSLTQQQK